MPRCALARRIAALGAGREGRQTGNGDELPRINEKQTTRRCSNKLDVFATVVRILQCLSAWCVYASLGLLLQHALTHSARGDHSQHPIPNYIGKLSSVTILYHCSVLVFIGLLRRIKTSATWRVFAVGTILIDSVMMAFAIAMITVLSAIGLPPSSFKTHDMRQLVVSYSSAFLGVTDAEAVEKGNLLCTLPQAVYILSFISIFSHTLSIVLTVLQFQRNLVQRNAEATEYAGHVEEAVPQVVYDRANRHPPSSPLPVPRGHTEHTIAEAYQQLTDSLAEARIPAQAPPTYLSNTTQHSPQTDIHWQNTTTDMFTNPPGWRSSQETTSSFNPDRYLVSDGFRPLPSPPAYTSRPSSLFDIRT